MIISIFFEKLGNINFAGCISFVHFVRIISTIFSTKKLNY